MASGVLRVPAEIAVSIACAVILIGVIMGILAVPVMAYRAGQRAGSAQEQRDQAYREWGETYERRQKREDDLTAPRYRLSDEGELIPIEDEQPSTDIDAAKRLVIPPADDESDAGELIPIEDDNSTNDRLRKS